MRVACIALALIAAAAGADGIHASVAGTAPSANSSKPEYFQPRYSPTVGRDLGDASSAPKAPDDAIRLAQQTLVPQVSPAEATSGNPSQAPYKWVGLLLIPTPTKEHPDALSGCTAQFITPKVLLTAGHCIKDLEDNPTGPWPDPTKGTFWLQYQNNQGTPFKIVCAAANPKWSYPSNYNSMTDAQKLAAFAAAMQHDYAMVLVDGTSPTGSMPYALDWKGKADFAWRVGYPADILGGDIVQRVGGIVFFADAIPMGRWSSPNLAVHWGPITDATHGMSGGGWIANLSPNEGDNNNILIAVTSGAPPGPSRLGNTQEFPGGTFAAYLTAAEFKPLLAFVSNGCK